MITLVHSKSYYSFLLKLKQSNLANESQLKFIQTHNLAKFNRTVAHYDENSNLAGFCIYLPSHYKIISNLPKDSILIYFHFGIDALLHLPAVQAHFRKIPLLKLQLDSKSTKFTEIADLSPLLTPITQICSSIFHENAFLLQIDTHVEFTAISLLMARSFHDDPIFQILAPSQSQQFQLHAKIIFHIASETSQHGLNFLLMDKYSDFKPLSGVLSSPAGLAKNHWGSPLKLGKIFLQNGISLKNLSQMGFFDSFHVENCGDIENSVYVGWICASVDGKGKGSGGVLMNVLTELCEQSKSYLYLENSKEANLGFYGKFGLVVKQKFLVKRGDKEACGWGMLRGQKGSNEVFEVDKEAVLRFK